jgi:hypothetical protein
MEGSSVKKTGVILCCAIIFLFFIIFVGPVMVALFSINNSKTSSGSATPSGAAAACGEKSAVQQPPKVEDSCTLASRVISSNGFYHSTFFGCSGGKKDPGDACDGGGCGGSSLDSINRTDGVVNLKGLSGPAYQDAIGYFSANKFQYGCGSRIKVTNPNTGQAVVVVVVDVGPNCRVQDREQTFDMSWLAQKAIGSPEIVKVEKMPDSTPIGPVSSCTTAFSSVIKGMPI